MPTYDYYCATCKNEFEMQRPMAEHKTAQCPKCHNIAKQQIKTAPGFELKGGDWPGKKNKAYSTRRS